MKIVRKLAAFAAASVLAPCAGSIAQAQTQEFHKGDHVLITPYGGAWAECTLTSDRLGYAHDYSYFAVCAPMSAGETPDNRPHQYSEERVKSVNDPQAGPGGTFKSPDQCKPGTRVTDKDNKSGTVTGTEGYMNGCKVRLDDGTEAYYLFWMLHYAGTSAETNDKLVPGVYKCYAGGNYTFMDLVVTGPNTYTSAGESGRYHVMPTRDIVFESGSLAQYRAHLLDGPSIGLNSNGDSFYGTTCDLDKK